MRKVQSANGVSLLVCWRCGRWEIGSGFIEQSVPFCGQDKGGAGMMKLDQRTCLQIKNFGLRKNADQISRTNQSAPSQQLQYVNIPCAEQQCVFLLYSCGPPKPPLHRSRYKCDFGGLPGVFLRLNRWVSAGDGFFRFSDWVISPETLADSANLPVDTHRFF